MENNFSVRLQVRDYECDMGGGVDNMVYQGYLGHARHEFMKANGINFAEFTKRKIGFVVLNVNIDYKWPLSSGDEFFVTCQVERISSTRFQFQQTILRASDNKLIVKATVTGTALNERGRPEIPDEIEKILPQQVSEAAV